MIAEIAQRALADHIVEGDSVNHQLAILVLDGPGAGGASHEYEIKWEANPATLQGVRISFQNGPIKEVGVNGVTQEALLAILIDRMKAFQSGPFACVENDVALNHLHKALANLQVRTYQRIARGVEGTHQK